MPSGSAPSLSINQPPSNTATRTARQQPEKTTMLQTKNSLSSHVSIAMCTFALSILGACQGGLDDGEGDIVASTREALGTGSGQLRQFIAGQVGGLDKLKVPSDDASIPLPPE